MAPHPDNLAWIDLEMTGLRPEFDRILEVATIVTDRDLNVLAEGPVVAVHQPEDVLVLMDDWNQRTHGASGLLGRVRESTAGEAEAELATLQFLERWVPAGTSPMCGNSICQDRRFLARYMPALEKFFHYRNLDVSTLKELARRWAPPVLASMAKSNSHQALDDVRESILELRHYRRHLFATAWAGAASADSACTARVDVVAARGSP
jgi:oligoribonuclease